MSKHVLDRARQPSRGRLAQFLAIARAESAHPASRLLHRRPRGGAAGAQKLAIYARIERRSEG